MAGYQTLRRGCTLAEVVLALDLIDVAQLRDDLAEGDALPQTQRDLGALLLRASAHPQHSELRLLAELVNERDHALHVAFGEDPYTYSPLISVVAVRCCRVDWCLFGHLVGLRGGLTDGLSGCGGLDGLCGGGCRSRGGSQPAPEGELEDAANLEVRKLREVAAYAGNQLLEVHPRRRDALQDGVPRRSRKRLGDRGGGRR